MTHEEKINHNAREGKEASDNSKKEWAPPQLTVLDVESSTAGFPSGNKFIDGVYS